MDVLLPHLGDYIVSHTNDIIERWVRSVDAQNDLESSESLTRAQLIDHLPALISELGNRFKHAGMELTDAEAQSARTHGFHRWQQGYEIGELVRESALVRQIIAVDFLDRFEQIEPKFDRLARREAEAVAQQFFSDMMVASTRHFAQEQRKALRLAEQNSDAILESALDAIVVIAADGKVREWNPAAEAMFGYTRAEAMGKELASLIIPPELREQHRRGLAHYLRTGEGVVLGRRIEVQAVRADGTRLFVELAITPHQAEEQTLFTGSIRDITQRQAAEQARQQLSAIVESSADAILSTDIDGNITSWNDGARQLLGYTAEEAIGQPVAIIVPEELRAQEKALLERIGRGERISAFETRRCRKDRQQVDVSVTISPVFDNKGRVTGFSRITRDITRRKQTQEELRRQKEAAELANQAKDRFLATLSHELRTPLNPVLMWAFATAENEQLDPELREGLEMICRNVELEARLIDDLLDLTRVARGKLKLDLRLCHADELLHNALNIMRSQLARKSLQVAIKLEASNHRILADPTRIGQVFWNLLANAAKFTPEKGEISVRSFDAAPGILGFEISDSGRGIDVDVVPRLFKPFEQGRAGNEGLGLGLTICRAILNLHDGLITGRNRTDGPGAVFTVELKTIRISTAEHSEQILDESGESPSLRILIVEDHEHTAAVMRKLLAREGHDVQVATTMRKAMEILHSSRIDLLVSDLGLPDGNGFQLMRELTNISGAKGIAISGYGMEQDVERSNRAGFSAHLTKPINMVKLKETIKQVIAGH